MYRLHKILRNYLFLVVIYTTSQASAYANLACNNHLNTSIGPDCTLNLEIESFIKGSYDLSVLSVSYESSQGTPIEDGDIAQYIGSTLTFIVTDSSDGLSCWGYLTIENKVAPVIICDSCTDPVSFSPECILQCSALDFFTAYDPQSGHIGYDKALLDKYIPSSASTFIADNVTNVCGDLEVKATYIDGTIASTCGEGTVLTRNWTISYTDYNGKSTSTSCQQYYLFQPYEVYDVNGNSVIKEADGSQTEGVIYWPPRIVEVPQCNYGTTPKDIAGYFDLPETQDIDSDGDGLDPDLDPDGLIENNEGIPYAFPHYYTPGMGSAVLHAQPVDGTLCNLKVYYNDSFLDACAPACGGNVKVLRKWTVLDWCTGLYVEYNQSIDIVDGIGPRVEVKDIVASVDPWQCSADVHIPRPIHLDDNCGGEVTYTVKMTNRADEIRGNAIDGYVIMAVPQGIHTVLYEGTDCCGNVTKEYVQLQVLDNTGPIPVTKANLIVDLTYINPTQGTAKIYAKDVDNGSYDSCSDSKYYIRRNSNCDNNDTLWREFVTFCCEDLDGQSSATIKVEFKVEDWLGNENRAWSNVHLEDKGSLLQCPPDMVVSCETDFYNIDKTGGGPMSYTACSQLPLVIDTLEVIEDTEAKKKSKNVGTVPGYIGVEVPAYNPACGFGAIRKSYDQCTQWIVVEPVDEVFDPSTIMFPEDLRTDCTNDITSVPTWLEATCNLVGFTLDSDTFAIETGACVQIENRWTVIDWCNYIPETDQGTYKHLQTIFVEDFDKPVISSAPSILFDVNESCTSKGVSFSATAMDEGVCASPWIGWVIKVDLNDDWTFDYTYSSDFASVLGSEPNPFYLEKTTNAQPVRFFLPDGINSSKSLHRIDWLAKDGCGNTGEFTTYFTIADKKAPTPYCLNLSTTVMNNGEVELWAIDFNQNSFDNCTAAENLNYTFTDIPPPPRNDDEYDSNADLEWYDGSYWYYEATMIDPDTGNGEYEKEKDYEGDVHRWEPALRSSGKVFTRADVTNDYIQLPIYVWDDCQNIDFCLVNLKIIDNNGGASGRVAGSVTTETGQKVENIMTSLMANSPGYPKYQMTDDKGAFMFEDINFALDYELSGGSDQAYLNGVSTLDLVMIQRHILGIKLLDSPYKMIAADINNDYKINGQDLLELRKLILGIYTELPQNNSWTLINASPVLSASNPWAYQTHQVLRNLVHDKMDQDFVAVKIGDVNADATLSNIVSSAYLGQAVNLDFNDQMLAAEEIVEVDFSTSEALYGYQMTINNNSLEVLNVTGSGLNQTHMAQHPTGVTLAKSYDKCLTGPLFTLQIRAKKAGLLSELMDINSDITPAIAFVGEGLVPARVGIGLDTSSGFTLHPNEPNPFSQQTAIHFDLPQASPVTLTFYNVTGQQLQRKVVQGQSGANSVKVNSEGLESGLIYYSAEALGEVAVGHMIMID